ncbi:hypothetical protein DFA_02474, partial [Cavenderia fasciculata]
MVIKTFSLIFFFLINPVEQLTPQHLQQLKQEIIKEINLKSEASDSTISNSGSMIPTKLASRETWRKFMDSVYPNHRIVEWRSSTLNSNPEDPKLPQFEWGTDSEDTQTERAVRHLNTHWNFDKHSVMDTHRTDNISTLFGKHNTFHASFDARIEPVSDQIFKNLDFLEDVDNLFGTLID